MSCDPNAQAGVSCLRLRSRSAKHPHDDVLIILSSAVVSYARRGSFRIERTVLGVSASLFLIDGTNSFVRSWQYRVGIRDLNSGKHISDFSSRNLNVPMIPTMTASQYPTLPPTSLTSSSSHCATSSTTVCHLSSPINRPKLSYVVILVGSARYLPILPHNHPDDVTSRVA